MLMLLVLRLKNLKLVPVLGMGFVGGNGLIVMGLQFVLNIKIQSLFQLLV